MKRTSIFILCLVATMLCFAQSKISIIPEPVSVKELKQQPFKLTPATQIAVNTNNPEFQSAEFLKDKLEQGFGKEIKITKLSELKDDANAILFVKVSDKVLGSEGYNLKVTEKNIVIQANENAGFFYAVQTLLQLIDPLFVGVNNIVVREYDLVPACEIVDYPRFAYRGKHLDVARHFMEIEDVKRYIDYMAFHKLNVLHWHLTDDQGWRLEIKQYPSLQSIASKRKSTIIGHYNDNDARNPNYDGFIHKGYYTQEQAKEIVAYAKQRNIDIIPEIEMPGHSQSVLAAYPSLGCKDTTYEVSCTWGVIEDVLCTQDETIEFMKNVLDEVVEIFPYKYVHIGGDECPKTRWKECPKCQAQIKKHGLKDEFELQSWFLQQITQYLKTKNRQAIAWSEILEGGIKDEVTVMSWLGEADGVEAARMGYDAVMVPCAYLYFDYYQAEADNEPLAIGGFTPLKKVYHYEPVPKEIAGTSAEKHIIGVQANMWREYIPTFDYTIYMDYPRTAAMSETAWSQKEKKNYNCFLNRLEKLLKYYDAMGMNYSRSHYSISADVSFNSKTKNVELELNTPAKNSEIIYTLDGSEPTLSSNKLTQKLVLSQTTTVSAYVVRDGKIISPMFKATYNLNKATGKKYELKNMNPQYSGSTKNALTDGIYGSGKSYDKWIGTYGYDYDVVVDLEKRENINSVSLNFLDNVGSWIFLPTKVHFYVSDDNKNWKEISETDIELTKQGQILNVKANCNDKKARYVKIYAETVRKCPEGHPGCGYDAHCFADEIIIK